MSSESESEQHMEAGSDSESEEVESKFEIEADDSESEENNSGSENEDESGDDDESGDEDESEDEELGPEGENNSDEEEKAKPSKKKKNIPFDEPKNIEKDLLQKYEERKGKSLFVLFPHKLPDNPITVEKMLKDLCTRIIKVRRPRQKSTRFCLVDFDNRTDRDKAMKELQMVEVQGKKLHVSIPKTENDDYLQQLVQKRASKKAKRVAALKLKKAAKKVRDEKSVSSSQRAYTSTLIVQNIPSETKLENIKEVFPSAVDIKLNTATGNLNTAIATVTMATPKDATKIKRNRFMIGENVLKLRFSAVRKGAKQSKSGVNGQKPSVKAGKHKLEQSSTDDLPSPKKKKIHLKKENDEERQEELMGQNKNSETVENRRELKEGMKQNKTKEKNFNKPNLKKLSSKGSPNKMIKPEQSFLKANKPGQQFKKANKPGQQFKKANKTEQSFKSFKPGQPFKKMNKPEHPFKKTNEPGQPLRKMNKPGQPFKKANKSEQSFKKTNKPGQPFMKTNKPGQPFKKINKGGESKKNR